MNMHIIDSEKEKVRLHIEYEIRIRKESVRDDESCTPRKFTRVFVLIARTSHTFVS